MSQLGEDLENAIEALDGRGWHQGSLIDDTGAVCLLGALSSAVRAPNHLSTALDIGMSAEQNFRFVATRNSLLTLLQREEFRGEASSYLDLVAQFNDAPETTLEDVKLLLKRGIEKAKDS